MASMIALQTELVYIMTFVGTPIASHVGKNAFHRPILGARFPFVNLCEKFLLASVVAKFPLVNLRTTFTLANFGGKFLPINFRQTFR